MYHIGLLIRARCVQKRLIQVHTCHVVADVGCSLCARMETVVRLDVLCTVAFNRCSFSHAFNRPTFGINNTYNKKVMAGMIETLQFSD